MYKDRHEVDPNDANIGEWLLFYPEDQDPEQDSTLEEEPYEDDHENEDDNDVSMYEPSQSLSMTSDNDNSEINSSFTHESVEIQSTKHTVDLEEGEIDDVSKSDDGGV
ncbi:hypothetical protein PsorP6_000452 [Peronosclerospora sorghi]|uniref:Uncharacterized protein n=1 Tax=Peronosclerospora sorghi TaxID=230839 RepID=A0ACC0WR34_9STRA|nr:hypothetical protein PsorP6_000452 [Peronosclerospora sorghi]